MPLTISIKNVSDAVVQRLRDRATQHYCSLQSELLAIIEAAAGEETPISPRDTLDGVRRLGLRTPAEATTILRNDRDARPRFRKATIGSV